MKPLELALDTKPMVLGRIQIYQQSMVLEYSFEHGFPTYNFELLEEKLFLDVRHELMELKHEPMELELDVEPKPMGLGPKFEELELNVELAV